MISPNLKKIRSLVFEKKKSGKNLLKLRITQRNTQPVLKKITHNYPIVHTISDIPLQLCQVSKKSL